MSGSELFGLFPPEYRDLIQQYIENLKKIFQQYDVVIFMARKAICLYKSLIIGRFIEKPENCEVYTNRILTYNIYDLFKNKKIILVDDVVKEGNSISDALKIISYNKLEAHVYIMARKKPDEEDENLLQDEDVIETFVEMVEEDRQRLSKYIADFIEANMCPYNIDQPIYRFLPPDDETVSGFIKKHNLIDTSSEQKREYGIDSYVLEIPNEYFNDPALKDYVELCKIRFLHREYLDQNVFLAIPFVLLREMKYEDLEAAFSRYDNEQLRDFIHNKNKNVIRENQLKILHYVLSAKLMDALLHIDGNASTQWKRLDSNDDYVFSRDVLQIVNEVENPFDFKAKKIVNGADFICSFRQNEYIGFTYDYIYSNKEESIECHDAYGEILKSDELLFLSNLKKYIVDNLREKINSLLFSNVIDVLIDKGLIIPSIVHGINSTIIRAYKYGEVYLLNESYFKLFTYALCEYLKKSGKDRLKKTEFEKLCVLFFKEAEKGILEYSKSSGAEDEYSICYSKFGPRVSTSKPIYSADKDSTLASKLITFNFIDDRSEKEAYKVIEIEKEAIGKLDWLLKAQAFAKKHALLYTHLFTGNDEEILFDEVRNMYMRTYIEFLIMLSIGLNKKNQLLSLLAEIYLVDTTDITKGNIMQTLTDYCRILDGLVSGMWKYMCYKQPEHPLLKVYNKLDSKRETETLGPYIIDSLNINTDIDKNERIITMIDEAGNLIFTIFYSIWFMLRKYNVMFKVNDIPVDLAETKPREFYYRKLQDLRKSIEGQIQLNTVTQDFIILNNFKLESKRLLECFNTEIDKGKKHVKKVNKGGSSVGKKDSGIHINLKGSKDVNIQITEGDSNSQSITNNVSFESVSDELIENLNKLLLKSEDKDKEAVKNAIVAVKKKDEKGFLATMRTVGKKTFDIAQNVLGNVICIYLRQKGILPP